MAEPHENTHRRSGASSEQLIAEAEAEPTEGWDFSWLDGRATEERPSWGYARRVVSRLADVGSVLDIQTGGGEVFSEALGEHAVPGMVCATEGWHPNVELARRRLARIGAVVVEARDDGPLPFVSRVFELVTSRHPTVVVWAEIARVLQPNGTYLSQQVASGSNRELTDFMMDPQPVSRMRSPEQALSEAEAAGLAVVDLRHESLEVEFFDVGAVVYFLRKVPWTVPGFSVEAYRDRLVAMDDFIRKNGVFRSHAERMLIEARRR